MEDKNKSRNFEDFEILPTSPDNIFIKPNWKLCVKSHSGKKHNHSTKRLVVMIVMVMIILVVILVVLMVVIIVLV